MVSLAEIEAAQRLVHASYPGTPQYAWPLPCERAGAEVWVKHENPSADRCLQGAPRVGLCRTAGARRPRVRGIVSATRGNQGQSLACAGRRYGVPVTIVAPHGSSAEKNAATRALDARPVEHGAEFRNGARGSRADGRGRGSAIRPGPGDRRRHLRARIIPRRAAA
jgi:threonine dehydratase